MVSTTSFALSRSLVRVLAGQWEHTDWSHDWPECDSPEFKASQGRLEVGEAPSLRQQVERRLFGGDEAYHKIISFEDDGDLVINDGTVLQEIMDSDDPVNLIVLFGQSRAGKSTFASMLSCSMMHGEKGIFFPSQEGSDGVTKGLWASPPFEFDGKKYMIWDMQGMGDVGGSKPHEDGVTKMLAMLSEVASVFMYVTEHSHVKDHDMVSIGHALKASRDHLITRIQPGEIEKAHNKRDKSGKKKFSTVMNVKSMNHPALVIVTRETKTVNIVDDKLAFKEGDFDTESHTTFKKLTGDKPKSGAEDVAKHDDFAKLLGENFQNHSLGDRADIPFRILPLPAMTRNVGKMIEYLWDHAPFTEKSHQNCAIYKHMAGPDVKCTVSAAPKGHMPSPPAVYRVMLDTLAQKIHSAAPLRALSFEGREVDLTGKALYEFLEYGVTEMNAIGPLPETELWRKIMQDACEKVIIEDMSYVLGRARHPEHGAEGALLKIDAEIDGARSHVTSCAKQKDPKECKDLSFLPPQVDKIWMENWKVWRSQQISFFKQRSTYAAVRELCEESAEKEQNRLDLDHKGKLQEALMLVNQINAKRLEKENEALQKELKEQAFLAFIDRHLWKIAIIGVVGLVVLIYVCKFTGKVHNALSCVCSPCGDICGRFFSFRAGPARPEVPTGFEMEDRSSAPRSRPPTSGQSPSAQEVSLPAETQKRLENLEVLMLKFQANQAGGGSSGNSAAAAAAAAARV